MKNKYTKFDTFKSYFSLDKKNYWWKKFTDYELQLSRMSLTELASELNRTQVGNETENSIIVEHMLAAMLVRIQTRTSWRLGWLSIIGAILVALLTFYLGQLSVLPRNNTQIITTPCNKTKDNDIKKPVQSNVSAIKQEPPVNKAIEKHDTKGDTKKK